MIFLETAELRAKDRLDITMSFWHQNVDKIIEFNDKALLQNRGTISNVQMEAHVKVLYKKFEVWRKNQDAKEADEHDIKELEELLNQNNNSKI